MNSSDAQDVRNIHPGVPGRILIFPGVYNTRFHLVRFADALEQRLPGFDVEIRPWGVPFLSLYNLSAYQRNLETARRFAEELAEWRQRHGDRPLYLVGYSGGGGLAMLTVAALPEPISVDRLVLVAPAISPAYPVRERVLPHVREFIANFASERDLQVGWGTRTFGTIDRQRTASAGALGFEAKDARILEWHWSIRSRRLGHGGYHLSYLGRTWQARILLPALDPAVDATALKAAWSNLDSDSESQT